MKLLAALLTVAIAVAGVGAVGFVWLLQPSANPFVTNATLLSNYFWINLTGGAVAALIVVSSLASPRGPAYSPFISALLANLVPSGMGFLLIGLLTAQWGLAAVWVGALGVAGTLAFWPVLRMARKAARQRQP